MNHASGAATLREQKAEALFNRGLDNLLAYIAEFGSSVVPFEHRTEDGFRLGYWCANRRRAYARGDLSAENATLLASLPGWTWPGHLAPALNDYSPTWQPHGDPILRAGMLETAESWFRPGLTELLEYVDQFGTAAVPMGYVTPSGFRLGYWRAARVKAGRRGNLSVTHLRILQRLPGWPSDRANAQFLAGLEALRLHVRESGRLPARGERRSGIDLTRWMELRGREWSSGRLGADRVGALESIPGWNFPEVAKSHSPIVDLAAFAAKHGHADVPRRWTTEDGFNLGNWVYRRRLAYARGSVSQSAVNSLESIPGWSWRTASMRTTDDAADRLRIEAQSSDTLQIGRIQYGDLLNGTDPWFWKGLVELLAYVESFGHAKVPFDYRSTSGFRVGFWCANRRKSFRSGALSSRHIVILENLPGWTWGEPVAFAARDHGPARPIQRLPNRSRGW
jgi:Helicase associated domain